MSQLTKNDLDWAVKRLPKHLKRILRDRPGRLFVAGGYLRSRITGEKVSDIDLFAPTKDDARTAIEDLILWNTHPVVMECSRQDVIEAPDRAEMLPDLEYMIHETDNAFTAKGTFPMVQAIHRWTFSDPVAAIESFDFTIAKAAIWWESTGWKSVCHPEYYADLAAKRLVYTSPVREEAPGGSLLRVLKFYQRGYRIPLDSLAAVLARLMGAIDLAKVDPDHVINKRGPMASKEEAIAFVLSGMLREVDPNIDPDATQPLAGDVEEKDDENHE